MSADEDSSSGPLISEQEKRMQNSNTIEALADIGDSSALMEESFNPLDIRDLQILLDNPQKHVTPFETYVSYRVTTKTTRADYSKPEYVERRRYSDFEWLRSHLAHSYPTHIIPPLPEKHTLFEQIDRYDKDFIQCRMQLLKRFLNRVGDHPVLSCDKHFKGFLTESPSDFSALKKTSQNPGIFGRMSESLHNIATSYVAKDRTAEFEKINEYVCKLAEKIQTMEKIGQRLQKERQAYMQDMNQMHPLLSQWASSEQCLSKGLQAIGIASASCVEAQKTLIDGYKTDVAVPLHEYGLYTESAKASLNHRDGAQIDYEVHMEQLCRVKTEQNQLETQPISEQPVMFGLNMWRSPEEVQQQRLQQLTAASATLAQQVEASRDKMECSNENFRADFERWNTVKTRDFKSMLTEMADLHIQFYEQCLGAWATALPFVKAAGQ